MLGAEEDTDGILRDSLWKMALLSPRSSPERKLSPPRPTSPDPSEQLSTSRRSRRKLSNVTPVVDDRSRRASRRSFDGALRDEDVDKLLQCRDCSVSIRRLSTDEVDEALYPMKKLCKPCSVVLERISSPTINEERFAISPIQPARHRHESEDLFADVKAHSPSPGDISNLDHDESFIENSPPAVSGLRSSFRSMAEGIKSFYEYPTLLEESDVPLDGPDRTFTETKGSTVILQPALNPPTFDSIVKTANAYDIPEERHRAVFCSNRKDETSKDLGVQRIRLMWEKDLEEFESSLRIETLAHKRKKLLKSIGISEADNPCALNCLSSRSSAILEPLRKPPRHEDVEKWARAKSILKQQVVVPIDELEDFDVGSCTQLEKSVVRVRRDSGDSVGSEITCSPPSPVREDQEDTSLKLSSTPSGPTKLVPSSEETPSIEITPILSKVAEKPSRGLPAKRRRISWDIRPSAEEISTGHTEAKDGVICETKDSAGREEDEAVLSVEGVHSPEPSSSDATLRRDLLNSQLRKRFLTPTLKRTQSNNSQIDGPSPNNTHAFKMSFQNLQDARAEKEHNFICQMSMELHMNTRQNLNPDPEFDSVAAVFYAIMQDVPDDSERERSGVIVVDPSVTGPSSHSRLLSSSGITNLTIHAVNSEREIFDEVTAVIRKFDPDILIGYEAQLLSWGFFIHRAAHLDINLPPQISRLPERDKESQMNEEGNEYGADHTSELRVAGRIVLNVWRLMRHEVALYSYTFEKMVYHVLHERVPKFSFKDLTTWWSRTSSRDRWRIVEYYMTRVKGNLRLLDQLDIVGRTSELAKIFGIQFHEVLSRGSQFRVESIMLRLAEPRNYVPVSPAIQQRAKMKAPEYIPLVMEPESRFYTDPVIVVDFQSLYPSIIMAYNYCYSTCLGRLQHLGRSDAYEFGCTELKVSPQRLDQLDGHLNFSPGGIVFVKPSIRKGILPQMLEEILDTRQMVKKSMKIHKNDKLLQRILHSRQLGLKLIANVTYGYTSANFSGRMPCIEVGDSVVSKGRETLERAIRMIETTERWGARVVYGDTDSVFVLLAGKTKAQAFDIGEEIARAVTMDNPKPVKLKFEKVYLPCLLQTKKRYVGYMYETRDQTEPVYDAKGIETVRRDGCPAVAKILEKSLRILFETKDVSRVKLYVQRQFQKILASRASVEDLTFAKEFRGLKGYKPGACVPALELTRRMMSTDRMAVPRTGQRVPYIVVYGEPGTPLIQSVRSPHDLIRDSSLRPNAQYYLTKVIVPPLNRCFSLVGADPMSWFTELPKTFRPRYIVDTNRSNPGRQQQGVILQYFAVHHCAVCDSLAHSGICDSCARNPQTCALTLSEKLHRWDKVLRNLERICDSCTQSAPGKCITLDCPVMYRKAVAEHDALQIEYVHELLKKISL